jgi:hypothetical protein
MIKYKFEQEDLDKCKKFSEEVDTSFYATRNQFNSEKRVKDSYIGKLGEIAVYQILKNQIKDITEPDFKIYKAKEKSWDFDLKGEGMNLHIKTQDLKVGEKYGVSWIFQFGDGKSRSYDKEIFDRISPSQYVAFVSLDLVESEATVRAMVSLDFLHEKKIWAAPKLDKLKIANKVAVYLKDLEKYPEELDALKIQQNEQE